MTLTLDLNRGTESSKSTKFVCSVPPMNYIKLWKITIQKILITL